MTGIIGAYKTMISFFRKIRQSLLKEGKTGRYFKYAIGEILLVVIGILIALQINNWNENKKDRIFELKMLKQIKQSLFDDKVHFGLMLEIMDELKITTDSIVEIIANKQYVDENTHFKLIFDLNLEISTQYNNGPYEALKASGIDKINDDNLRNNLIDFYEFNYPKFISRLEHFDRNYLTHISSNVELLNDPEILIKNGNKFLIQNFPEGVFNRPGFQRNLRSIIFRRTRISREIKGFVPEMQLIIDQLDTEIAKEEKP